MHYVIYFKLIISLETPVLGLKPSFEVIVIPHSLIIPISYITIKVTVTQDHPLP